jgi:hypothetical protein
MGRRLPGARRTGLAAGYAVVMLAVALGGAGVVAMWSHPPGTDARAELTWHGDSTLAPELDSAQGDLATVAGNVDRLSVLARGAIATLTAEDQAAFADAISEGGTVAAAIQTSSAELRARLAALPGVGPADAILYGSEVLGRRVSMIDALEATEGLGRSWAILTAGGLQASHVIAILADHDTTVAAAAAQGRAAKYADALVTLKTAVAMLATADTIRNQLANSADVSTLDQWIGRNRRYDTALTALYTALRDSGGRVTTKVKIAFNEEIAARAELPPDTRGLVVIIADIGRGGLNQAVIAIEQARGRLDLALEALTSNAGEPGGPAG